MREGKTDMTVGCSEMKIEINYAVQRHVPKQHIVFTEQEEQDSEIKI